MTHKNTICLWFDGTRSRTTTFYADTFADSAVRQRSITRLATIPPASRATC